MKKMILMAFLALSVGVANADSQMRLDWEVGAGADYALSNLFPVRFSLDKSTSLAAGNLHNINYSLVSGYKFR